ncbi:hypothetical protein ACFVDH_37465, partial [Streptomyces sp. NPDC057674]
MPEEHRYEGLERSLRSALSGGGESTDPARTDRATTDGAVTGGAVTGGAVTGGATTGGAVTDGAAESGTARGEAVGRTEASARTAFRAARDAGLHVPARTRRARRRDDWTPGAARRLRRRSLRIALVAAVASVSLGGAALAAVYLPSPFAEEPTPAPETSAPTHGGTIDA